MAEILLGQLRGPSGFEHPVVIKRILPHLARDPQFVSMFLDEAQIGAGIRHANVVHVHELGQEGDDLFMVMEYLEGESVANVSRRALVRGIQVDPLLCAWIAAEAAAGLHAAHELKDAEGQPRSVVHRDVSPSNIYITYSGSVKVLDFGIAKAADRMTKTDAGHVKGKFGYMSPEHCRGEPIDRRSDIFGLGIVLYEMLTGRRLFQRPTQAATLRAVLEHDIVPPSELAPNVPPSVEAACMKALSRARRRRYDTAAELRRDLMRAVHGTLDDTNPEQRMVALMQRLFPERIEEKKILLRRVESGEDIGDIPLTMADMEVELPEVDSNAAIVTSSVVQKPTLVSARTQRARRKWAVAGATFAVLALGAIGWLGYLLSVSGEPRPDPELAGSATNGVGTGANRGSVESADVQIRVESTPADATVLLGDEVRGQTPVALSLPRGEATVTLRLELDGHAPIEERIIPNVDQHFRLSLVPTPRENSSHRSSRPRTGGRMRADAKRDDPANRFRRWD